MPDLPWFVYAMLLAPLGLLLVVAAYKIAAGARGARMAVGGGQGGGVEVRSCARSR